MVVHNSDPVVDCVAVSVVCLEIVGKTDVVVSAEVAKIIKYHYCVHYVLNVYCMLYACVLFPDITPMYLVIHCLKKKNLHTRPISINIQCYSEVRITLYTSFFAVVYLVINIQCNNFL